MKKTLCIVTAILGIIVFITLFPPNSYAQNSNTTDIDKFHRDVDSSPIEVVIMINEHRNGSVFFQPEIVTVRIGGEILVANNASSEHSVTSGEGPQDPLAGKFFNTDIVKPRGFVEYVPENLKPGNYSFYSSTNPDVSGQLVVISSK